ncbi:ATP-grasp domain-containing protein [Allomeiothermus silvanus]|uniref:ATP-grasp domain-containing protein n=1 Tax=Allomeiothermus silvanus TaxID=52022 RepID=UPI0023F5389B|nr:ATP-grasp domain-containing protein [Allomeiothermus silvanus]
MNVVFLSPHFPPNFYNFCVRLREAGANVLGLADAPYESLRPELKSALTEYYRVSDMHHYDELLRALGYFTHRYGKIDRLDSLSEYWLETEAALRTDFNIYGIRQDSISKIKRKSEMKKLFQQAGLRVARGRVCHTPDEARAFVKEVGYPVVAKPDVGVGAAKTYKIIDEWELQHYLSDKLPVEYILEEFIPGTIVTYDGLADREGRVIYASSMIYSKGVMETVLEDSDIYYYMPREIPRDLDEAGRRITEVFGVKERPFHYEFFRLEDGGLVALEVNMRPPGGLTVDMFNYAGDLDFYKMWAEMVVKGETHVPPPPRPYYCAYVGRKYNQHYLWPHEAVLHEFGPLIVHHEEISGIFAQAIGNYGYILRHPELAPLLEACEQIQRKAV